MKKLLAAFLALGSVSSYANNIGFECKYSESIDGQSRIIAVNYDDNTEVIAIPVVQGREYARRRFCPVLAANLNNPIPKGYNSDYNYAYSCKGNSYGAGGTLELVSYKIKRNGNLNKGKVISSFRVETGVNDGAASDYIVCKEYVNHLNKFLRKM
jgi:hypothetical protein